MVGLPSDGEAAISAAGRLKPQVIVMDVIMPPMNGIHTCSEIMDVLPDTRVVMMTACNAEDAVVEAIAAAATRYLEKYSRPAELVESVVGVPEGRLQLPEEAMKRVLTMFRDERMRLSHRLLNPLTDLERETLIRGQFAFPEEPLGPVGFLALGLLSLTGKAQSVDSGLALCSRFRQGQDRRLRERTPVECAINGWSCD